MSKKMNSFLREATKPVAIASYPWQGALVACLLFLVTDLETLKVIIRDNYHNKSSTKHFLLHARAWKSPPSQVQFLGTEYMLL